MARHAHAARGACAHEWADAGEDRSRLLRGSDLRAAETWYGEKGAHEEQPTDEQYRYITQSRRGVGRRQRAVLVAVSVALVTAIVLAVFAFIQRNRAQQESYRAQTGEMVAEATNLLSNNAPAGMLVAINAARRGNPTEASRNALGLAARQPVVTVLNAGTRALDAVASSPDERTIAAADDNGTVTLWDLATKTRTATLNYNPDGYGQKATTSLAFSPDGAALLAAGNDGAVTLWNVHTHAKTIVASGASFGERSLVTFSPTGALFAASQDQGPVQLYDAQTRAKVGPAMSTARGRGA